MDKNNKNMYLDNGMCQLDWILKRRKYFYLFIANDEDFYVGCNDV